MPQPGDSSASRLSTEDAFLELLTDTLDSMERPARGQFLEKFFKSIAHVDLNEARSLDIWDQVLARKRELTEQSGKKVALQTVLVDVLASAGLLRLPIVMEYEELRKLQIDAATDPLTGLYNRRLFDDHFEKELNRSQRYSHHLALVVFDLATGAPGCPDLAALSEVGAEYRGPPKQGRLRRERRPAVMASASRFVGRKNRHTADLIN